MRIKEWMTTHVVHVTSTTSMLKVTTLMAAHDIRCMPVVDDALHVVGIVSDRDVRDASPSKATTLDRHELQYLLSGIKVHDIMTPTPITVLPDDTIEHVALIMESKGFGALPVVDKEGILVGIISEHDLYKVFIEITGVRKGGLQLEFELLDEPGSLCALFNMFCKHEANVLSVLTDRKNADFNKLFVHVRISNMPSEQEEKLLADCTKEFTLRQW